MVGEGVGRWGRGSILRHPPCPAQEPLCLPWGQGGLAHRVCIFRSITGLMGEAQTEMVSHVPILWQARAPGLRGKGGHGAIVLTLGTVRKQAPQ